MNIESKKGDKVIFTGKGGYDSENEYARNHLKVDQIYVVDYTIIHNFNTEVILEGFPKKKFNSVLFDDANVAEEYHSDIIESLTNEQPKPEDYINNLEDYVDALLVYIERLKKEQEIQLEMYAIAMDEDQQSIKNQI